MKDEFKEIAEKEYKSKNTIDMDLLMKIKSAGASYMDAMGILLSLEIPFSECKQILSESKYYGESHKNTLAFTDDVFDKLERANRLLNKKNKE